MIAKGNLHAHGRKLARYLVTAGEGERVELVELAGFASPSIHDAFTDVHIQAGATDCQKPFFHCYMRLPPQDQLGRDGWRIVADRIEHKLGFTGQGRAVAFHHLADGTTHMHVAWSRIDIDSLRAIDPGLFKNKLKEVSRELERDLGLTQISSERRDAAKTQTALRSEFEQSRRLRTDLEAIRGAIRASWDSADSGRAFVAALEERGLILARGDRRAFVVVDLAGGDHALGKRITGATAALTTARLADLDRTALPTVEAAKAKQYDRSAALKAAAMSDTVNPANTAAVDDENRRRDAQRSEDQRRTDTQRDEDQRREANRLDADNRARRDVEALRQSQQQAERQVEQAEQMRRIAELHAVIERYNAERQREAEQARQVEAWQEKQRREEAARPQHINDAGARYGQALGQHYDVRDPFGSLARAAMAEHGAFVRDREALNRQLSRTDDPAARQAIEMRKQIELCDYMAITSNRIATQSEIIQGRSNTDEAMKQRERAAEFQKESAALRQQLREHSAEATAARARPAAEKATPAKAPAEKRAQEVGRTQAPAPLMVADKSRGDSKPVTLAAFVKQVEGQPQPKNYNAAELATNSEARRAHNQQEVGKAQRTQALDRMGEAVKAGRPVEAEDVKKLNAADIAGIRRDGDRHLHALVQERTRERESEKERGRSREL